MHVVLLFKDDTIILDIIDDFTNLRHLSFYNFQHLGSVGQVTFVISLGKLASLAN